MPPTIEHWGNINYPLAHERQKHYVEDILAQKRNETIVLCSHSPVVTLGRAKGDSGLDTWKGAVYPIERGGRATYHGPGQMVCYALLNLKKRDKNLGGLLNALEMAVVDSLLNYRLQAKGNARRERSELSGVWVGHHKVASLGIAVRRWVTYHGLAVNLHHDPAAFQGLRPCGLAPNTVASLEQLLGFPPKRNEFEQHFIKALLARLP